MVDFLSSMFNPQNFAGVTGLLDRMSPAMSFTTQQSPGFLPPQTVTPAPQGGVMDANAMLPENAMPTSGVAPMGLVPPQATAAHAPSFGGPMNFLGGVQDKINDNSNMLLGLAAGIAGGKNWGDGLSKGMTLAMTGGQLDTQQGNRNRTQQFLLSKGMDPEMAHTVASNPTLLRSVLPKLMGGATTDKTNDVKNFEYAAQHPEFAQFLTAGKNGGSEIFGTPIYGRDPATGKQVLGAMGKDGQFHKLDTGGVEVSPGLTWKDFGTYEQAFDRTGNPVGPARQKDLAGAETAKAEGKARGEVRATLPSDIANADQTVKEIDALIANPGLNEVVGPIDQYRGSVTMSDKGRDALARYGQLQGKAFLDAYATLKGGGQITEVEGAKAQSARARMDRAQSESDFIAALKDFRDAVKTGVHKLREKAGVSAPQGRTSTGVSWSIE